MEKWEENNPFTAKNHKIYQNTWSETNENIIYIFYKVQRGQMGIIYKNYCEKSFTNVKSNCNG